EAAAAATHVVGPALAGLDAVDEDIGQEVEADAGVVAVGETDPHPGGAQRREGGGGREDGAAGQPEDHPAEGGTAALGRAVQVAVAGLDETGVGLAAVGAAEEGVKRGDGAVAVHLEDGALVGFAAGRGRAVEGAAGPDETVGLAALGAAREGMQRGDGAGAIHPEEGAAAWPDPTGRPVEVAVAALDEGVRHGAATEGNQGGDGAGRVHLEGGPATGRAEVRSRAVEVAVA